MSTPICDFVNKYIASSPVRMHMPGHKGKLPYEMLREISQYDITEIAGADSLFEADGILAQSEENAAMLLRHHRTSDPYPAENVPEILETP